MKKIKIISFMLLTILSCLKFATATEKNQSPIENAYEKTQNNQLEEEKEDEKLVENGASKKEILLENNANEEEILDKEANEEKILEKDTNKKEILNKDADEEKIKEDDKKEKTTKTDPYKQLQKTSQLPLQKKNINMFDYKKIYKTDLIKQISEQLTTINKLINNNKENLSDDNLISDLEQLQQNLLNYKEKIKKNSSAPEDLESLVKKAYNYIEKLGEHVVTRQNSKNDERIKDMYENLQNFAYLDYFAKNYGYDKVANNLNEISTNILKEINNLESYIIYIYNQFCSVLQLQTYWVRTNNIDVISKVQNLKTMLSKLEIFKFVLQGYYSQNPRNIIKNIDRHNIAKGLAQLCNEFIKSMSKLAEEVGLNEIVTKIFQYPNLTCFARPEYIDTDYYKDVFNKFNVGMKYFEKGIYANNQRIISNINTTKQNIQKVLNLFDDAINVEDSYKISSGFVTEIYNFFAKMSSYFKEKNKICLPDYVTIMSPLPDAIRNSGYVTEVKAGTINTVKIIKSELKRLKLIDQQKEKSKTENKYKAKENRKSFSETTIEPFEKYLDEYIPQVIKASNFAEISRLRYELSSKTIAFKQKSDKHFQTNDIKNYEFFCKNFPGLNSYSKTVPQFEKEKLLAILRDVVDNLNKIEQNFNRIPSKYYPYSLKNNLRFFRSSLNTIINNLKKNLLKYDEWYKESYSFAHNIYSLIKNAIQPLEEEQNLEYCSKISNNANELKRLIHLLEKTFSDLSKEV